MLQPCFSMVKVMIFAADVQMNLSTEEEEWQIIEDVNRK